MVAGNIRKRNVIIGVWYRITVCSCSLWWSVSQFLDFNVRQSKRCMAGKVRCECVPGFVGVILYVIVFNVLN